MIVRGQKDQVIQKCLLCKLVKAVINKKKILADSSWFEMD